MDIKLYGTRGSLPICRSDSVTTGGNTTSLRVFSQCIPAEMALAIDAGSGFAAMSADLLKEGIMYVAVAFTHWHPDHTQGLFLAPHTFIPTARMRVFGPKEHGIGPVQVFGSQMTPPLFPVEFEKVRHRFNCSALEHIGSQVLIVHPDAGFRLVPNHVFEAADQEVSGQLRLGKSGVFNISDCLVIKMLKTAHPEYTISYRLEERPTGRIFVFLTDHENTDGMLVDFKAHIRGAHLIIQDCQYPREVYDTRCGGFGHGTPDYCARVAIESGVEKMGLTHHDVGATDEDVQQRLNEARTCAIDMGKPEIAEGMFFCYDYQLVVV